MKIAIDLLWVRHNQVGGIEAYVRNLLDGFCNLKDAFELILIVSKDNSETFKHYELDRRFSNIICNVESKNVGKRIIWQNIYLGRLLKENDIKICFEPYYGKPYIGTIGIKFITTIHDLQALHYPEYFRKGKVAWMKMSWRNAVMSSQKVVAISQFVKDDILNNYKKKDNKIQVIYNPIVINTENILPQEYIEEIYGVKAKDFYFTVSSLLPHKNLETIILVMSRIIKQRLNLPHKLIISGVGGKFRTTLENLIIEYDVVENIIMTEFINDNERNSLYKYCKTFLFPSVFEGFGMPPIEALAFGTPVITTRETSIPEVTHEQALYVQDAFDADEWIAKMSNDPQAPADFEFDSYKKEKIAREYLDLFEQVWRIP